MTPLDPLIVWITIIISGLITFAIRLSFIVVLGQMKVPETFTRALRFVPAAVLSALILPDMLRPGGELNLSIGNPRLLAGLVAGLVAWGTKNILLTIIAGMASLWLFQFLLGG
jgi:branched-subunit amino acid transport protein